METSEKKPLYTLTPDEVEFITEELIPTYLDRYEPEGVYQLFRINPCKNLLTKLRQYQDGNK